jgi:hypothetical protein
MNGYPVFVVRSAHLTRLLRCKTLQFIFLTVTRYAS